jgi:hypothetical protein
MFGLNETATLRRRDSNINVVANVMTGHTTAVNSKQKRGVDGHDLDATACSYSLCMAVEW